MGRSNELMIEPAPRKLIDWSVASRAMPGQKVSGDVAVVTASTDSAFVAAVDGLGHGHEAAEAARTAVQALANIDGAPLTSLVHRCHEALKGTRGAVMSLASLSASSDEMAWLGLGNVAGWLVRATPNGAKAELMPPTAGIVGHEVSVPEPVALSISRGDLLIFATDGIRPDFVASIDHSSLPRDIAHSILGAHATQEDDALIVVARYLGA
jgi:phosphoserine phosphatase RsbX